MKHTQKQPDNNQSEEPDADATPVLNGETVCINNGKSKTDDLLDVEQSSCTDWKVIWKQQKGNNPKSKLTNFCGTVLLNNIGKKIFVL